MSRPRRFDDFPYVGRVEYFVTFCTRERRPTLATSDIAQLVLLQFRRTADLEGFALIAYCIMPDHVHLIVSGRRDTSDLRRFVKMAKQRAGAAYAMRSGQPLWQKGYYERILRRDEDVWRLARYVIENPVRAGLVGRASDYPHVGSDVWPPELFVEEDSG